MAFLLAALEKDRGASYGDLKAAAEKKNLAVFPIMYGRAQALLGIVKAAKRGEGKAAKATKAAKAAKTAKASAAPARAAGKRGRPMNSDSKSGRIRALLQTGMSAADIAAKVGCTTALVYNVKSAVAGAGGGAKRRGPGRPAKAAAPALSIGGGLDGIAGIVAAVKQSEQQRASLHAVLVRIQAILADALN